MSTYTDQNQVVRCTGCLAALVLCTCAPPDTLPLVMLAMEVGPLVRDLGHWEPVGVMAETIRGTVAGVDGLTDREIQQARNWARRWQLLHPGLRGFYTEHAPAHGGVGAALYAVLQGTRASPGALASVHMAWRDNHGHAPPWSLIPRVP